jgi:putative ABC transport system ATP-binding protein
MDIVSVEQVSKRYQENGIAVDALRKVDLRIQAGEFLAMVGPSGSGKTTLLNLISGLDVPTSGRIWIEGRQVVGLSKDTLSKLRLMKIGFVFQEYNLIQVLSALENVEYVMQLQKVPARECRDRAMHVLKGVGLAGMEHRLPRELSGGQQQRVAVARAIASDPAIVMADEPTANLDSTTGGALMDLMRSLNEERRITFVFSTHDPMVMERARRIVRLKDGKVENDGMKAS